MNSAFDGQYPCRLSPTCRCTHGGNKRFNYGFASGTAAYCYKSKVFIKSGTVCPLVKYQNENTETKG